MKKYHLKKSVRLRLQGLFLILLAYAAHRANADDAALLFCFIGIALISQNVHILSRLVYKAAKRIYRKGRWMEICNK